MSNRFMISVATLALFAGTGLANAQGTMNRDSGGGAGGAQMQHSQPSSGAAERGAMGKEATPEKGTVGQAGGAMKPAERPREKSSGAAEKSGGMEKSGPMNKERGRRQGRRGEG